MEKARTILRRTSERDSRESALQIFSDGGYDGKNGAAAAVIVSYVFDGEQWLPTVKGHKGIFLKNANSAFHAELFAADVAIQMATKVGQLWSAVHIHGVTKRARFY